MKRPCPGRGARSPRPRASRETMPDMLVEARRVANTVLAGWHGRRVSGRGETFWQFRPFVSGEAAASIDWRRSARDEHLFVRETEWEAAHTLWLWPDLSGSMDFRSRLATVSKRQRAIVLTLALAEMLASAGERVGLPGAGKPDPGARRRRARWRCCSPPPTRRLSAPRLTRDRCGPSTTSWCSATSSIRWPRPMRCWRAFSPPARARISCRSSTPARRHSPIPDGPNSSIPRPAPAPRNPRRALPHRISGAACSAPRATSRALNRRAGWTFLVHRTDRPATEPLLALHARLADRTDQRTPVTPHERVCLRQCRHAGRADRAAGDLVPPPADAAKAAGRAVPADAAAARHRNKEEQPARSPWWLTALRLALARR